MPTKTPTRRSLIVRLLDHAEHNWLQLAKVQARYHGSFAYITGALPSGQQLPLFRLRYGGSAHSFGFAMPAKQGATEFLTTFTVSIPEGTPARAVQDTAAREAQRAKELAGQGHLLRLWMLPGQGRALGLWRARDAEQMQAIVKSLPLDPWMTTEIMPLTPHPSDPAVTISRCQQALGDLVEGRPEPFKALWSHAGDVVITGAFGGYERGWDQVSARLDWAAAGIKGDERHHAGGSCGATIDL
jgi:muconolactone delta-isomerase